MKRTKGSIGNGIRITTLVYIGITDRNLEGFMSGNGIMSSYDLTPGKEYDIIEDSGLVWVVDNKGHERAINGHLVPLYFKQLSELRDNKLTELGI
jgi:hypothetical protein